MFFSENNIEINLKQHAHFRKISQCVSTTLDISLVMSTLEDNLGFRPIGYFTDIREFEHYRILMNPFKRDIFYQSVGCSEENFQQTMLDRITKKSNFICDVSKEEGKNFRLVDGLYSIPALVHQPQDAGRYLTSAITATRAKDQRQVNLGIYRIQVVDNRKCHIFLDPKSDGYKNMQSFHESGVSCPVTITLGNDPVAYMVAAGNLKSEGDDLNLVERLSNQPVQIGDSVIPTILPASIIINGHITQEKGVEAEFGEFKGFYCEQRMSPVLEIDSVQVHNDNIYFGLVAGKESGLNLMALRNEVNMYIELSKLGLQPNRVRYTLEGKAEFICKVWDENPSHETAEAVMRIDPRVKFIMVYAKEETNWSTMSLFPFETIVKPYFRRGKQEGMRVCMIQNDLPKVKWIEY